MVHFRLAFLLLLIQVALPGLVAADGRPNVFIAVSDDQSWPHASAYGVKLVHTPSFDRIAREGVLFRQAFCASPGCSPSRAGLLTGLNTWQLEHAGTHASWFHPKFVTFADRLSAEGYFVGYTGKGWGPGDYAHLGRQLNPAGKAYSAKPRNENESTYVAAFAQFLRQRPGDQPFCFWFGSHDAHRGYEQGSGLAQGKQLGDAEVPAFLPDAPVVRSDLLDYATEVERFDRDLGRMLALLEAEGELDDTLLIVTSDNGMPFPRAKANCYEYGIHVPLAICWGERAVSGRAVDDLVGFIDITATIYDATGVEPPQDLSLAGKSLKKILESPESGIIEPSRTAVYAARERHSSSRFNSLGYPQRAIRTHQYLYIRNFTPERWPAGAPQKFERVRYSSAGKVVQSSLGKPLGGFHDIDACPTLTYLVEQGKDPEVKRFLDLAVAKRPAEELFDIKRDPACLENLADRSAFATVKTELSEQLDSYLRKTHDARVIDGGDIWEMYPRVSRLRWFPEPDWAAQKQSPLPPQPWLEERRPSTD